MNAVVAAAAIAWLFTFGAVVYHIADTSGRVSAGLAWLLPEAGDTHE